MQGIVGKIERVHRVTATTSYIHFSHHVTIITAWPSTAQSQVMDTMYEHMVSQGPHTWRTYMPHTGPAHHVLCRTCADGMHGEWMTLVSTVLTLINEHSYLIH